MSSSRSYEELPESTPTSIDVPNQNLIESMRGTYHFEPVPTVDLVTNPKSITDNIKKCDAAISSSNQTVTARDQEQHSPSNIFTYITQLLMSGLFIANLIANNANKYGPVTSETALSPSTSSNASITTSSNGTSIHPTPLGYFNEATRYILFLLPIGIALTTFLMAQLRPTVENAKKTITKSEREKAELLRLQTETKRKSATIPASAAANTVAPASALFPNQTGENVATQLPRPIIDPETGQEVEIVTMRNSPTNQR